MERNGTAEASIESTSTEIEYAFQPNVMDILLLLKEKKRERGGKDTTQIHMQESYSNVYRSSFHGHGLTRKKKGRIQGHGCLLVKTTNSNAENGEQQSSMEKSLDEMMHVDTSLLVSSVAGDW